MLLNHPLAGLIALTLIALVRLGIDLLWYPKDYGFETDWRDRFRKKIP